MHCMYTVCRYISVHPVDMDTSHAEFIEEALKAAYYECDAAMSAANACKQQAKSNACKQQRAPLPTYDGHGAAEKGCRSSTQGVRPRHRYCLLKSRYCLLKSMCVVCPYIGTLKQALTAESAQSSQLTGSFREWTQLKYWTFAILSRH